MTPIHELLNRILWDQEFARGEFRIGYFDREEGQLVRVPLAQIHLTPGEHFFFQAADCDGCVHEIPFHRIKELYKDGKLIWHREH